jgi:hypothetical protein
MAARLLVGRGLAAGAIAAGLLALGACGSRTGLFVAEAVPEGGPDASADAIEETVGCKPGTFTLELATAQLMFVLDRSGSMAFSLAGQDPPPPGQQSRWAILRDALFQTIVPFDGQMAMGAKFFPEEPPAGQLGDPAQACRVDTGAAVAPALGWIERRTRFGILVSRGIAVLAVLGLAYELGPIDVKAPMVVEAQWDRPNVPVRAHVTDCLRRAYHGESVLASMGSLGHYMQEMSRAGFRISDFVQEGNGDLWLAALEDPQPYAGWMLVEEKAEGGDVLAKRAREDPAFLDSFVRVCDGAGVALYRREDRRTPPRLAPRRQPRSSAAADGGQNLMPIVNR